MASISQYNGVLDKRLAAHLLRRSTYSWNKARIDALIGLTPDQAVDQLFVVPPLLNSEPLDYVTLQPWINSGVEPALSNDNLMDVVSGWWINEAIHDTSISHKLQFFLHSVFVISHQNMFGSRYFFDYLELIRFYSLGSFKTLSKKMTLDNLMLDYLDGEDNTDSDPNENYAREYLELFTIGKGPQIGPDDYTNFTELDVVEAAKLLSGWKQSSRPLGGDPQYIDPDTGIQAGYGNFNHHDTTDKTFSYAFGGQTITGAVDLNDMYRELDDFVDMVFNQDETARTICRRLYRYFVSGKIDSEIETDIIEPMATTLRNANYVLEPAVKQLLKSQHFYDMDDGDSSDEIVGALIKSPLELLGPTMNFFQIDIIAPEVNPDEHYDEWYAETVIDILFKSAGYPIFEPESVAGYPAYYQAPLYHRNWLDTSTVLARYTFPDMLLTGNRILAGGDLGAGIQLDIVDFVQNSGVVGNPANAQDLLDDLVEYLLPEALTPERENYFLNEVLLDGLSTTNWFFEWLNYLNTGDASAVRIPLENLFRALIFSREYQLM
ncbi:MAG: DUF1800 family protein [Saprospiraceae bacterium]|nr:DUF1800 family protein [Saprospiraceae bacterium]